MTISNQTFREDYEYFLTKRGQPTHTTPVSPEIIQSWVGKLPNILLYTWQELGWCCFNQGLLWTVNPDEYKYLVDTWLEGTPYQTMDNFHCFARTAFGDCILYGENRRGFIKIMPQFNTIWADDRKLAKPQSVEDAEIMMYLQLKDDNEDYDMENSQGELFFERALEKLGAKGR